MSEGVIRVRGVLRRPQSFQSLTQNKSGSSLQADGLGSITALADSSGTILASYTYDAFGNVTASTGSNANPYRYTGRDYDSETGLYYYRARYYDSAVGRFLSEDPLRWSGGSDFFSYVANNPALYVDPTGLKLEIQGDMAAFIAARDYLKRDAGMAAIISQLEKSDQIYRIYIATPGDCKSYGDVWGSPGANTESKGILWYANCGWKCESGSCRVSPALILGHELAHLSHPKNEADARRAHVVKDFGNAEEQWTIAGPENNAAITLHECLRTSHQNGALYNVSSPTAH